MPNLTLETKIVEMELGDRASVQALGHPSSYTCPECSGPIWTIEEGKLKRFRCQVGHGYSLQTLLRGKYDYLEKLMAQTINAYEEIFQMSQSFANDARKNGFQDVARELDREADHAKREAEEVRQFFKRGGASQPESRERRGGPTPRPGRSPRSR